MDLLRAWTMRLLGGGLVAAVLPVAVIAAAALVGVGGGGLAGLGSLRQAVSGPAVPSVEPAPSLPGARARDPERLLDRAYGRSRNRVAARRVPSFSRMARRPARPGGSRRSAPRPRAPAPRAPRPPRRPPAGTGPSPSPDPSPTPTPGPPSTVRRVGDAAKEATRDVPVAGEPTGQVVDLLVETVESLPGPTPGP